MNCTVESYDHDDRIIVVVRIKRDGPIDLSCFTKGEGIGIVARFRFLSDFSRECLWRRPMISLLPSSGFKIVVCIGICVTQLELFFSACEEHFFLIF